MIFIIVICVVFIVLCLMVGFCACLRIAGLEDEEMIRQSEEEPIEMMNYYIGTDEKVDMKKAEIISIDSEEEEPKDCIKELPKDEN